MKPIAEMTLAELAAYIWTHLNKHGIHCVLSGGACVSIYSSNKYQSYDLDFVENVTTSRKKLKQVLAIIGFDEENRYFKHGETKFILEFPAGPLSIGSEPVKHVVNLKLHTGNLALLSPTDCVKDRLAAYYHWHDLQCLEQAILVASNNTIDMKEIQRWSEIENKAVEFQQIKSKLQR